jgi:hypothetical protein
MLRVRALGGVLLGTKTFSNVGNCTINLFERLLVVVRGIFGADYRYFAGVKLSEAKLATDVSLGVQ